MRNQRTIQAVVMEGAEDRSQEAMPIALRNEKGIPLGLFQRKGGGGYVLRGIIPDQPIISVDAYQDENDDSWEEGSYLSSHGLEFYSTDSYVELRDNVDPYIVRARLDKDGLSLLSPNGTSYRIQVTNAGAVEAVPA